MLTNPTKVGLCSCINCKGYLGFNGYLLSLFEQINNYCHCSDSYRNHHLNENGF